MGKRGQAALEFLMNYGIAIMVVLIALGALAYFGLLNPAKILPSACFLEPGLACIETKVNRDSVVLRIRNGKGENLNISSIKVANCNGSASGYLKDGTVGEYIIGSCNNNPNFKYSSTINITYAGQKSDVVHAKIGSIVDTVENNCGNGTNCGCLDIDTSCGAYPSCNNCNAQDSYSANYCTGADVYRDFFNYGCASQACALTTTPELLQSCTGGTCSGGSCACLGTDINCGTYPGCNNCNNLDSYSANYCNGNSVYKNFTNYGCASQTCSSTTTPELQQNCAGSNGICQNGACSCANSDASCGTYPSCNNCASNNGKCQSGSCACSNTQSSCGTYPSCSACGANQACQGNQCVTTSCSDGTPVNTCSATKPQYCNSGGTLVNSCSTCGCPSGKVCQGDGSCVNAVAQFSASYSNLCPNCGSQPPGYPGSPYNWWNFDTTLRETGGIIGVTVNQRQKCFNSNVYGSWCDPVKTDISIRFGTNSILAGGQIVWNNNAVWFYPGQTVTVTETFWGVDGNSNNVQASYSFNVVS
ncbi:hypothetical protein HYV81_04635 [Candidatus Woesearchaeota archaeon]|nr:hypothetical protein [Candidatus Woesearchaeota archaeon]